VEWIAYLFWLIVPPLIGLGIVVFAANVVWVALKTGAIDGLSGSGWGPRPRFLRSRRPGDFWFWFCFYAAVAVPFSALPIAGILYPCLFCGVQGRFSVMVDLAWRALLGSN